MTKKYYIENTTNAQVLHGSAWRQFVGDSDVTSYSTLADAEAKVGTLATGDYKIFVVYYMP